MSDENVGSGMDNTNPGTQNPQDVSALLGQLEKLNAALAEKDAQYKGLQKTYNTLFESNKTLRGEHENLTAESLTLKNQLDGHTYLQNGDSLKINSRMSMENLNPS